MQIGPLAGMGMGGTLMRDEEETREDFPNSKARKGKGGKGSSPLAMHGRAGRYRTSLHLLFPFLLQKHVEV